MDSIVDYSVMSKLDYLLSTRRPVKGDNDSSDRDKDDNAEPAWIGVKNQVDRQSIDEYCRKVGWYVTTIDGKEQQMALLSDALRAYDAHVFHCKGNKTKPSDINLAEEWAFPTPFGVCPPVHIGGGVSGSTPSGHGKGEVNSLTASQHSLSKAEATPTVGVVIQSKVKTNQAAPRNEPTASPHVVPKEGLLREVVGVVLSFYSEEYREIMFDHFRKLGKRPSRRLEIQAQLPAEEQIGKDIFTTLTQKKLGRRGRFFRKEGRSHDLFEVGDGRALEKILEDLRGRNTRIDRWLQAKEEVVEPTLRYYPKRGDLPETSPIGSWRGAATVVLKEVVGVTLSYYNTEYREIMFTHFREIGKRPLSQQGRREHKPVEDTMGNEIFATLKQKLGRKGRFFRKEGRSHDLFEAGEEKALEKILDDLRARNNCVERWFQDGVKPTYNPEIGALEPPPSNLRVVPSSFKEIGEQHFILSYYNDVYTDIMHDRFKKIGQRRAQNIPAEDKLGKEIFATLKKKLGRGGHFFKKAANNHDLFQVEEDEALQKVMKDLRGRHNRIDKWLQEGVAPVYGTKTEARSAPSSSLRIIPSQFIKVKDQNFVLSYFNDEYTAIMHNHFRKIGLRPTSKEGLRAHKPIEHKMGSKIFATLRKKLGKGGHFLKKLGHCHDLVEAMDNEAMQKVLVDLRGRNNRIDQWLQDEPEGEASPASRH